MFVIPNHPKISIPSTRDNKATAHCSDLVLDIEPAATDFFIEMTLSRGESDLFVLRLVRLQKLFLSAFMAHWTEASRICRGIYEKHQYEIAEKAEAQYRWL